jgi:hypothetical protein
MEYWQIALHIRGYYHRNVLQYQLQRMNVWASMFCMGNPKGKEPQEIIPLYFDKNDEEEPPTEDEVERMRQEIIEENKRKQQQI